MRRFELIRNEDVSGVSGTGVIAEGVEFGDRTVVVRWHGKTASTVCWASIDDAMAVHGHEGRTSLRWLDADPTVCSCPPIRGWDTASWGPTDLACPVHGEGRP